MTQGNLGITYMHLANLQTNREFADAAERLIDSAFEVMSSGENARYSEYYSHCQKQVRDLKSRLAQLPQTEPKRLPETIG
jgi:hypothetical protein